MRLVARCNLQVENEVEFMKTNSISSCWSGVVATRFPLAIWTLSRFKGHNQTSSFGRYSVGYFYQPDMTLDEAQLAKMEMIGRKLDLKPGILDKSWKKGCQHVYTFCQKLHLVCQSSKHAEVWCFDHCGHCRSAQTSKSQAPNCSKGFVSAKRQTDLSR